MIPQLTVALLAQAIGSAFALGALLLLLLTLLPKTRAVAWQLWPLLASEVAILAVGILPWLLPPLPLLAFLVFASARIGFESGTVHGLTVGRELRHLYAIILAVTCALAWAAPSDAVGWALAALLVASLAALVLSPRRSFPASLAQFAVFPLLPLAAFSHAASEPRLAPFLVLAFFLVEMFDSFSLLGGKLYGRTPLVPRLSPRKTWEGLATGVAAVMVALVALVVWLRLPWPGMLLVGATVIVAAIVGDLLGSLAKRRASVKDYPAVVKVQGGLLDITDAWLVAGPSIAGIAVLLGWV
jgi:phosphatidate cytidylyltransferase